MGEYPTVAIVLRQPLLRDALRSLFQKEGIEVVGTAATAAEAVPLTVCSQPDVLLLDCGDDYPECRETLQELCRRAPAVGVLLYAGAGAIPPLPEVILAGARGIVLDDVPADLLFRAVRCVHRGEYWVGRDSVVDVLRHARQMHGHGRGEARAATPAETLTGRELEVIRGIASGESNRELAGRLGLSPATIKYHVTAVYDKLGVSNRAELAALAVTRGLTQDERL